MIVTEEIPVALAGERLDRIVSLVGDLSRSQARELVAAGGVSVDGRTATSG
ncbi:MAG: pseudouridine synthase RluD, partial [Actinomycetota bacterium]